MDCFFLPKRSRKGGRCLIVILGCLATARSVQPWGYVPAPGCRRRCAGPREVVLAGSSQVEDWEEGRARYPELQEVAAEYRLRLEQGLVRPEDLGTTQVRPGPWSSFGCRPTRAWPRGSCRPPASGWSPGKNCVISSGTGAVRRKPGCWPRRFSTPWTGYDTQYYLELLAKAVGEVLWPWKSVDSQDASKCALNFAASNKKKH